MAQASIKARLGLDTSDFKAPAKDAGEDVKRLSNAVKEGAAYVAQFERSMRSAGGGTAELKKQAKEAKDYLATLRTELKQAERDKKAFDAAMSSGGGGGGGSGGIVPKSGGGGHGGGINRAGSAELGHSTRAFLDSVLAGQSPLQAAQQQAPSIVQAFGGGIGTIAAVGAITAIASKLYEAHEEAKKTREELGKLGAPLATGAAASIESIKGRLKELGETRAHLEANQGSLWQGLYSRFVLNEDPAETARKQAEDMAKVNKERSHLTHAQAEREGIDTNLNQRGFSGGEDTVAIERIRNKYAQERVAISEQAQRGEISGDRELIEAANQREKLEIAIETHRQNAAAQSLALETQLLQIKHDGANVEVASAEARRKAAVATLASGPQGGEERAMNVEQVHAAEEVLRLAQRTRAEHEEELGIRRTVADVTLDADRRHIMQLALQEQMLKGRLASGKYGADDQDSMSAALAENQVAQDAAFRANRAKSNQAYLAGQSATYGRGANGQLQGLSDRAFVLGFDIDANTAGKDANGKRVFKNNNLGQQQIAEAAQLKRQMEDIEFSQKQTLDAAVSQTKEMQLHARGNDALARVESTRAGYQERIAAAMHDGNTALASQLIKQQALSNSESRKAAYGMSGPDQNAERTRRRNAAQADERFNRDDGLQNISRDISGNPVEGYDPLLQKRRAFGDHAQFGERDENGSFLMPSPNLSTYDPNSAGAADDNRFSAAIEKLAGIIVSAMTYHPK